MVTVTVAVAGLAVAVMSVTVTWKVRLTKLVMGMVNENVAEVPVEGVTSVTSSCFQLNLRFLGSKAVLVWVAMRVTMVRPRTIWFAPASTTSALPAGTVGGVTVSGHTLLGVGAAAPIIS